MALHIIIDGYNLIRQSSDLSALDDIDLQAGREALIDLLAAYKKLKPHRITVVFDGANAPPASERRSNAKGIEIRFSGQGELADQLINRMVRKAGQKALVVSSDREVAHFALGHGAAAVPSPEFANRLAMASQIGRPILEGEENGGWTPTTKKKGPSRRLPKKARRLRAKTAKL